MHNSNPYRFGPDARAVSHGDPRASGNPMWTRRFGDDVAVVTPGSTIPTLWTPGLVIAGLALLAAWWLARH